MTRSLRLRWTLALVAVCLVEAALVAVAVRASTARAFEQFLVDEALVGFTEDVATAVRETGSVAGVRPGAARRGPRPQPGLGGPPRAVDAAARPPGRPVPAAGPRGDDPTGLRIRFGLADPEGYVVVPFDGYAVGTRVPPDRLRDGRPIRVGGVPVGTAFVPEGATRRPAVFSPRSPEARFLRASTQALAWALAGALAVALTLGVVLTARTVGPLRALTAAARRIAAGDLRQSVAVESSDEVGQLAAAFNAMSARLDEATALRQRMTADISHDLRTPLTAVLGTLEAVASGALPATPARIATAYAEAQRLGRLVDDLHTLALADADALPVHLGRVDAVEALAHTARLFEAQADAGGLALVVEAEAVPPVRADRDRLVQALGNLVGNAIRHTPAGGRIALRAWPQGGGVALAVVDSGEGIAASVLPVVFERSVRGDAARSGDGSGLGLSIVRSLVAAMGGTVTAASEVGVGTTMTIRLRALGPDRDAG